VQSHDLGANRKSPILGILGQMEEVRYFYILVLAVFVISGRKFRDAWRDDGPKGKKHRLIFGGLCLACFLVVAFFEVRL
jgi:hypothetical protein